MVRIPRVGDVYACGRHTGNTLLQAGLILSPHLIARSRWNLFPAPRYSSLQGQVRPFRTIISAMTLARDEDLMLQVRDGAGEMLGVLFDRYQTRSEEHTSELQSQSNLVCRLLLEKKETI